MEKIYVKPASLAIDFCEEAPIAASPSYVNEVGAKGEDNTVTWYNNRRGWDSANWTGKDETEE